MNRHTESQRTGGGDDRFGSSAPGPSSPPELVWENEGGHLRRRPHNDDAEPATPTAETEHQ